MAQYLIESTHTKQDCLEALDELMDKSPELLDKMEFGCMDGEHKGWATVEADSKDDVLNLIPTVVREKAHVVQVSKFTPEQIASFHSM